MDLLVISGGRWLIPFPVFFVLCLLSRHFPFFFWWFLLFLSFFFAPLIICASRPPASRFCRLFRLDRVRTSACFPHFPPMARRTAEDLPIDPAALPSKPSTSPREARPAALSLSLVPPR